MERVAGQVTCVGLFLILGLGILYSHYLTALAAGATSCFAGGWLDCGKDGLGCEGKPTLVKKTGPVGFMVKNKK